MIPAQTLNGPRTAFGLQYLAWNSKSLNVKQYGVCSSIWPGNQSLPISWMLRLDRDLVSPQLRWSFYRSSILSASHIVKYWNRVSRLLHSLLLNPRARTIGRSKKFHSGTFTIGKENTRLSDNSSQPHSPTFTCLSEKYISTNLGATVLRTTTHQTFTHRHNVLHPG